MEFCSKWKLFHLSNPDDLRFKNNSEVWVPVKLNLSPGHLHHPQSLISRMWRWGRFLCMRAFQVLLAHFVWVSHSPLPLQGSVSGTPPLLEDCWTLTKGEINHTAGLAKHNIQKDYDIMKRKSEKSRVLWTVGYQWEGYRDWGRAERWAKGARITGKQFSTYTSFRQMSPFHSLYYKNNSVLILKYKIRIEYWLCFKSYTVSPF